MLLRLLLYKKLILFFLIIKSTWGVANVDISLYNKVKQAYPNECVVQLFYAVDYDISENNGAIEISFTRRERIIFLKDAQHYYSDKKVYSNSFVELSEIEAYSYIFNGSKYKKVKVEDFKEVIEDNDIVFHDDSKTLNVVYPGIKEGSVIELKTVYSITDPQFIRSVFLQHYLPTHEMEINIAFDKNIEVELLKFNENSLSNKFIFNENKKKKNYVLKSNKIEKWKYEQNAPDFLNFVPHVFPLVKNYSSNGEKVRVIENAADLYKRYHGFIKNVTNEHSEVLVNLADSLTQGLNSELSKVKVLYKWVQSNVKYIAIEEGLGGFVPANPNKVLSARYGDCKGKSTLLYSLLKHIGIKSHLTWIGTRDLPYTYSELPTLAADNHMILTYKHNNKCYFLDPTSNYLSIDYPTSFIQGKEAMISIDSVNYEIRTVPVTEPECNFIYDSILFESKEGLLTGTGTYNSTGYTRMRLIDRRNIQDEKYRHELYEGTCRKGSNKFVLGKMNMTNENIDTLIISYDFTLDNYITVYNDELFINMNFSRGWTDRKIKEDRVHAVEFDYNASLNQVFVYNIPHGYEITYMPANYLFENEFAKVEITYDEKNNHIIYKQKLVRKKLLVDKPNFGEWNKFIVALEMNYKETVSLKKK